MAITIATVEVGGTGAANAAAALVNLGAAPTAAYVQANTAYNQANTSYNQANTAYAQANTAYGQANLAYNAANNAFPTINIVTNTAITAIRANHYILKNTNATTVTLPASPNVGDLVWITVANGLLTNNIARNGSNIQGAAEDLTVNVANAALQLRYAESSLGWIFS